MMHCLLLLGVAHGLVTSPMVRTTVRTGPLHATDPYETISKTLTIADEQQLLTKVRLLQGPVTARIGGEARCADEAGEGGIEIAGHRALVDVGGR